MHNAPCNMHLRNRFQKLQLMLCLVFPGGLAAESSSDHEFGFIMWRLHAHA